MMYEKLKIISSVVQFKLTLLFGATINGSSTWCVEIAIGLAVARLLSGSTTTADFVVTVGVEELRVVGVERDLLLTGFEEEEGEDLLSL